jgi:hypothetical protein
MKSLKRFFWHTKQHNISKKFIKIEFNPGDQFLHTNYRGNILQYSYKWWLGHGVVALIPKMDKISEKSFNKFLTFDECQQLDDILTCSIPSNCTQHTNNRCRQDFAILIFFLFFHPLHPYPSIVAGPIRLTHVYTCVCECGDPFQTYDKVMDNKGDRNNKLSNTIFDICERRKKIYRNFSMHTACLSNDRQLKEDNSSNAKFPWS